MVHLSIICQESTVGILATSKQHLICIVEQAHYKGVPMRGHGGIQHDDLTWNDPVVDIYMYMQHLLFKN